MRGSKDVRHRAKLALSDCDDVPWRERVGNSKSFIIISFFIYLLVSTVYPLQSGYKSIRKKNIFPLATKKKESNSTTYASTSCDNVLGTLFPNVREKIHWQTS